MIENGIKFKDSGDVAYKAIVYAAQEERFDVFKLLAESGANVNAEEKREEFIIDVLTYLEIYQNKEFLQYLQSIKELFSDKKRKKLEKMRLRVLFNQKN